MHNRTLNVQRLAVHLPLQQNITFRDSDDLQNIIDCSDRRKTTLIA